MEVKLKNAKGQITNIEANITNIDFEIINGQSFAKRVIKNNFNYIVSKNAGADRVNTSITVVSQGIVSEYKTVNHSDAQSEQ